jgi:protein involved in polysaccharide export with SLBB domain
MTLATYDNIEFEPDTLTIERRRVDRVKVIRGASLTESAHGRQVVGSTRDVSATGVRLAIPAAVNLKPGDRVSVNLYGLAGLGLVRSNRSRLPGRVVWVKRSNRMVRPSLLVGVEFTPDLDAQVNVA